mmetsp:Transcript_39481/g.119553  ORF Transcript_39481/g.119553 Transcript_39481/m.119553 type:complete len:232 (+) Transcript_39481:131-826(+)
MQTSSSSASSAGVSCARPARLRFSTSLRLMALLRMRLQRCMLSTGSPLMRTTRSPSRSARCGMSSFRKTTGSSAWTSAVKGRPKRCCAESRRSSSSNSPLSASVTTGLAMDSSTRPASGPAPPRSLHCSLHCQQPASACGLTACTSFSVTTVPLCWRTRTMDVDSDRILTHCATLSGCTLLIVSSRSDWPSPRCEHPSATVMAPGLPPLVGAALKFTPKSCFRAARHIERQ